MSQIDFYGEYESDLSRELIATVIVADTVSDRNGAHFFTDPSSPLQVSSSRYQAGRLCLAHMHPAHARPAFNGQTQEVLVIMRGKLLVRFWDSRERYAGQWTLNAGDAVVMYGGGHSVEALELVELIEVKQGGFNPAHDKIYLQCTAAEFSASGAIPTS